MTKLGILVGEGNWAFFKEIFDDLAAHYQTEVFRRRFYSVPLLYGRLNRWAFREGLRSMLRRNDICFFEWASDLLLPASQIPKSCAIITRLHSFELYEWAPKINWDSVDRVILVSQAMRQKFVELFPEHSHKARVVYNGKSLDKFKLPAQRSFDFRLGMLGEIAPVKRVYEVILMLYNLREQGYNARLYIAGDPAGNLRYAAAVHRLVEKLGLQGSVIFQGYVTDTQAWLHNIDIFISNSYWEGQQVALIEAMASGCYCLAHFWDGAEEVLPSANLYSADAQLQEKIVEYYSLPSGEKNDCQAQLRALACEKFDIERTKSQIREVIENV